MKGQTLCIPTLPRDQTVKPATITSITNSIATKTITSVAVTRITPNRCVFYTIVTGDTCSIIASKLGITLNDLDVTNNNINCRNLQVGKEICLNLAVTVRTTTLTNNGNIKFIDLKSNFHNFVFLFIKIILQKINSNY